MLCWRWVVELLVIVLWLQAYRLEPLIVKHYAMIKPLEIHCYGSSSAKEPYESMAELWYSHVKALPASKSSTNDGKDLDWFISLSFLVFSVVVTSTGWQEGFHRVKCPSATIHKNLFSEDQPTLE